MTDAQKIALSEIAPTYCINYSEQPLTPSEVFGREAPLVLEVGFGNGESLAQLATDHPEWNFIGIEVHEPGVGHCLLRIERAELSNLRLIQHDAVEVMGQQIPARSVSRVNLYFPDPWPKKRHHKRRLLAEDFLNLTARVLTDEGTLNIATDWANYAEQIDETMAADERYLLAERSSHNGDAPLYRPTTKFERRGLRLGHEITDWVFKLNPAQRKSQ